MNVVVTAAAGVIAAALSTPAFAQTTQQTQPPPVAQPQTQAPAAQPPAPVQHVPFVTPGPRVDITIEQAVQLGMKNNISIGVARITPRLTDFSIVGLEASYHPNLTSSANNQRQTQLPRVSTQGIQAPTTSMTQSWSAGVAQNLWWGGGNYSASWTNSRLNSPASINIRNPQFQSNFSANFTQPILRGFKIDPTRAAIQTNRLQQSNDEISLTTTTETTEDSIRNAYWNLVFAYQSVEVAQSTLDIANTLVQQNQQKVEIGTLAPLDVTTAKAQAAADQLALVQAEANVRTAELSLKQLIVSGTDDPLWASSVNPVDRPAATPEPINVDAAIARALRERTDLRQSMNNLKIANINLENQVDQTRPQLNLTANYGLAGLGGPVLGKVTDPLTGITTNQVVTPSGYADALRNILGLDAPTWTLGFSFSYPLGMSAQEATVARTKLSLEQTQANLKQLQLQIAADVTSAALSVQSALESVQSATTARELSKQEMDAQQAKFEVGMATNYEIQQAQRDYANAQNNELRAILNYRQALVSFEASQTVGSRSVGGGTTTTLGTGNTGIATPSGGSSGGGGGNSGGGGGNSGGGL
jgi:outer membrane protein